jgi:D-cysteine desulfhydrase
LPPWTFPVFPAAATPRLPRPSNRCRAFRPRWRPAAPVASGRRCGSSVTTCWGCSRRQQDPQARISGGRRAGAGRDTLITCGAPQSNHCRITLAAAVKEGLQCRFVIEERVPGSYTNTAAATTSCSDCWGWRRSPWCRAAAHGARDAAGGRRTGRAGPQGLHHSGRRLQRGGRAGLRGLCAGDCSSSVFDQGLRFDRLVVGSGSSGTHGGMVAGFLGNHIDVPIMGIGVSRDPADQQPLVIKEAQAVADLLGVGLTVTPRRDLCRRLLAAQVFGAQREAWWRRCNCWPAPKAIPLDPVYTGKIMAGLIGLARQGHFQAGREGAVPAHRRPAVAVCVCAGGAGAGAGGGLRRLARRNHPVFIATNDLFTLGIGGFSAQKVKSRPCGSPAADCGPSGLSGCSGS